MTKLFSEFSNDVLPYVPTAPYTVVERAIRRAAIEVCEKTQAWVYYTGDIELAEGVQGYSFPIPEDTAVCGIFKAAIGETSLKPVPRELFLSEVSMAFPAEQDYDTPVRYSQLEPGRFFVHPVPDGDETYKVQMIVALKPTSSAVSIDRTVFEQVNEAMFHGALYYLYSIPDKPWSSMDKADHHGRQFSYNTSMYRAQADNSGVAVYADIPHL